MKNRSPFLALAILLMVTACQAPATPPEMQKIRLPMGFIANIQYAPFYVAIERGYFAEAGIELEFDYSFETDGVRLVGINETQFALVSGEQVLLARAQQVPVVYVVAWYQEYPIAVVAKQGAGISTPADLVGKKVGLPGLFGATYIGLRALLDANGVSELDLSLDAIGFNQVEALATDQEQAVVGYFSNEPVQLRAQGYEVVEIRVADYVDLASNGIITNEETIASNPELVRRFVRAFLRGLADTIADPDQAYEISKGFVEGLAEVDEATQKQVLVLSIDFWKADRPGFSDPASWENMQETLLAMGLLDEPLDLSAAFTNEFIE